MLVDTLNPIWADVSKTLVAYRDEVDTLRAFPGEVTLNEDVADLHARLVRTRQAQDRLEVVVGQLGLLRARLRVAVAEADNSYDDAWREVSLKAKVGEYSTAKERDASYTAGCIDELIKARTAKRKLADVEEVYDYALFRYRGLDGSRRDIESRARLLAAESTLQR